MAQRGRVGVLLACACACCSPATAAAYHAAAARPPRITLRRVALPLLLTVDDDDGDSGGGESDSGEIDAFRAQLMRQFAGVEGAADAAADWKMQAVEGYSSPEGSVERSESVVAGMVLVADPRKFCSRNPFARPVKDLERFGLKGPIPQADQDVTPDLMAQMLPVLLITEHDGKGSRALLLERRTGALMGDISMDDFGCVAISPLWLGGTARQSSLYTLHTVPDLPGAQPVCDGMWVGGWDAAKPKVADSSISEERFKFFLGVTEWAAGQLQKEVDDGAWLPLKCTPDVVFKDRVISWRPGKPKPLWTELVQLVGDEETRQQVYPSKP